MRLPVAYLFLAAGTFLCATQAAALDLDQVFAEGTFDNSTLPTGGVSVGAGGNVNLVPSAAPTNGAGIYLQSSGFGYAVAGGLGYKAAQDDLRREAERLINQGTRYRATQTLGGQEQIGIGNGAWVIRFPGSRDPETYEVVQSGDPGINYVEDSIREAAAIYRDILRIDPYDTEAAKGLLRTYYERMVPLIYAANIGQLHSFMMRITEQSTLNDEADLVKESMDLYDTAIGVFAELTGTYPDVTYLDGAALGVDHSLLRSPVVASGSPIREVVDGQVFNTTVDLPSTQGIVPRLLETYARALSYRAAATETWVVKRYLALNGNTYPVPAFADSPPRQSLVADIATQVALMQHALLLFNGYTDVYDNSGHHPLEVTDIGEASQRITALLSRRDLIRDGFVFFEIGVSSHAAALTNTSASGVYSPEHVPFLYKNPDSGDISHVSYDNMLTSMLIPK